MRGHDDAAAFNDLTGLLTLHGLARGRPADKNSKRGKDSVPLEEPVASRLRIDVLCALAVLCLSLVVALLLLRADTPITGSRIALDQPGYDAAAIHAPALSGTALNLVSKFLSSSRFGPWVRRSLLNQNELEVLRELSAQCRLPPMDYPLRRVDEAEWVQAASDASWYGSSGTSVAAVGFDIAPLQDKGVGYTTIMEYHAAYKEGKTTPYIVMRLTVGKAEEWEKEGFHIFSSYNETDILRQANSSTLRYAAGEPLSVFDGVPVAFKDVVSIYGHAMRNGMSPSGDWGSVNTTADDSMVARFRELGAIIFGTTIMTEGGMSPLGYNAHYKGPVNAYSSAHFSGGSSSGSAVAVASGLVPVAIGFDSGGSIRIPAAWSGLHGLAPTFGRVPLDKELYMSMIKAGPIANSALDAALAYSVIAAKPTDNNHFYGLLYDGGNRGVPHAHVKGITDVKNFSDIRIGLYPDWAHDASPEVTAHMHKAIKFFTTRGATIVEIDIPNLRWLALAHGIKISTEYAMEWDLLYSTRSADLDANSRILLSTAASLSALEVISADRVRAWAFNYTANLFKRERLSVIVTPTVGFTAPIFMDKFKSDGVSDTELVMKTMKHVFLANLVGLPAHSAPIGFSKCAHTGKSLPIGLQLIGKHWGESTLLRMANAIDQSDLVHNKLSTTAKKEHFFNPLYISYAYSKMKKAP